MREGSSGPQLQRRPREPWRTRLHQPKPRVALSDERMQRDQSLDRRQFHWRRWRLLGLRSCGCGNFRIHFVRSAAQATFRFPTPKARATDCGNRQPAPGIPRTVACVARFPTRGRRRFRRRGTPSLLLVQMDESSAFSFLTDFPGTLTRISFNARRARKSRDRTVFTGTRSTPAISS